jgi:Zn-dependent protease
MFGRGFRIATIRGVPVNVDSSWIWIAVLLVATFWSQLDQEFPDIASGEAFGYAVFGALVFFGSVFLHEAAHAIAARANGIEVHGITLVFFGGFTAARADEKGPGPALAIAALGPGTSLGLSGVFWLLSRLAENTAGPLPGLLSYVAAVNLFMAIFNALPGLPLDGGRMLQSVVWRVTHDQQKATRIAARSGLSWRCRHRVRDLRARLPRLGYAIWGGIIGLFIFRGAQASEQRIGIDGRLASATVADAMDPPPPAVPADLSLSLTLDRFLRGHEDEAFPVIEDGDGDRDDLVQLGARARDPRSAPTRKGRAHPARTRPRGPPRRAARRGLGEAGERSRGARPARRTARRRDQRLRRLPVGARAG